LTSPKEKGPSGRRKITQRSPCPIYRWTGDICDETETRAALHTRRALVPAIVAATQAVHPYEVPGIFVLPLVDGSPAYLQWIRDETDPPVTETPAGPTAS
jgi:uncharacterized protein involved in tolerance to divalent cations